MIISIIVQSSGITANLMSIISQKLNFSWTIYTPPAGAYGSLLPDGSEDGLVGELSMIQIHIMHYC